MIDENEKIEDHYNSPRRTTTATFRVEENLIRILKKEAEDHEISLNVLINQVLKRYVEWHRYEPKIGMFPMAKPVLVQLFDNISEDKIIDIATNTGRSAIKEMALFMKHKMNLESFLEWFEMRMKSSFIEISHEKYDNGNCKTHSYIVKHDLGKNWSLYHKVIFEFILQDLKGKPLKNVSVTSTMFAFDIEE